MKGLLLLTITEAFFGVLADVFCNADAEDLREIATQLMERCDIDSRPRMTENVHRLATMLSFASQQR